MATDLTTKESDKDWTSFFSAKGGGVLQELFDEPLEANDEVTLSYVLDEKGFLDATETYPFNWVLVPGLGKAVRLFHSCFASEGKLIGVLGCRSTAPFKQINLTGVSAPISIPPEIRSRSEETIPTLEQFLQVGDEEDFSTLVGEKGNPISTLSKHPSSFWVHPHLFLAVSGPKSMRAAEMALLVLLSISEEGSGDNEHPTEDKSAIYNLLVFLWSVEKRWATAVLVLDPPDTDATNNACAAVARCLEDWQSHQRLQNEEEGASQEDGEGSNSSSDSKRKRRKKSKRKKPPRSHKNDDSSKPPPSRKGNRGDSLGKPPKPRSHKLRKVPSFSSSSSSSSSSESSDSPSDRSRSTKPRRSLKTRTRKGGRSPDTSPDPSSSDDSSISESSSRRPKGRKSRKTPKKPRRRRTGHRRSDSDSSEDLRAEFMQSLVRMNKFQRDSYKRESRKKYMLNRLPDEQVKLYTLLSARDWRDSKPRVNNFTEDLLSDRDPERAWNQLETVSRDWPGEVCKTGLIHFLSKGFRASDVDESPGGFTAFMFSSIDIDKKVSRKDRELAIRSVFGEDAVTDEVVKYYAKNDLFLASSYEDAKNQLRTCLKCLERLTYKSSIGTDGYSYGIDLLSKHRRKFMKEAKRDPQIYIKFVYMLDQVFQNFVSRLGAFHRERHPIEKAKGSLRGSMRSDIDQALGGFDSGVIPNLSLPEVVSSHHPSIPSEDGKKSPGGKNPGLASVASDDLTNAPPWWSENPEKVAEWCIPSGKHFRDFFTPKNKENLANWPRFKHHRHPKVRDLKPLCIKYHSSGSCRAGCRLAHIKQSATETAKREIVASRFREIYKIRVP